MYGYNNQDEEEEEGSIGDYQSDSEEIKDQLKESQQFSDVEHKLHKLMSKQHFDHFKSQEDGSELY